MPTAKDIRVAPISQKDAALLVRRVHYSGKIVNNSQLHLGVFIGGALEGVMSFGACMDKRRMMGLVSGTGWNDFLELNRMAFSDRLPRNSESRALSVAFRIIKKHYPNIEWIVSFADGAQCGDGTIYRASGFVLTNIKKNNSLLRMPDGSVIAAKTLDNPNHIGANGRYGSAVAKEAGARPLEGFQLRYVYFLNAEAKSRLTVPIIPFSHIAEVGAGMYKGQKTFKDSRVKQVNSGAQSENGGAAPTHTLQLSEPV